MTQVETVVYAHLALSLGCTAELLAARAEDDLDMLGLDSHGLMTALLGIERELGVAALEPSDAELASPRSLAAAVARACGG